MSEQHSGPIETGAPMNYAEHEKTYDLFINGAKYGSMMVIALLAAMAVGFFAGGGFFGGLVLFIVLNIFGFVLLR
ncbi:aa3-type cytochrome c oxidase subunit IV [Rhizobiaceae bacterium n13]|uniref:Aa3-type cytochrome c oxidase subunit IV n=1 Tax=Ferirhizobium litorale TaxID=2927786 RepID=A0AAE3TZ45_9HYPH|nr:aa3-type cytochrome c oxidase subunit IV [Fererhizobium litorale]MDI7860469.1 aa3-type cytochrome c oxidase subunit IV [Fererhizobium litorale]MDI7920604.1 aa3-type cytochrome c oxidase subunit IV [Fererhizobium litorale]